MQPRFGVTGGSLSLFIRRGKLGPGRVIFILDLLGDGFIIINKTEIYDFRMEQRAVDSDIFGEICRLSRKGR
jgi:hypothetical protein